MKYNAYHTGYRLNAKMHSKSLQWIGNCRLVWIGIGWETSDLLLVGTYLYQGEAEPFTTGVS